MAVSYPLTLPSSPANFRAARFKLSGNTGMFMSQLSRVQQISRRAGQLWFATFIVPPIVTVADAAEWKAFLTALRGREGTFRCGDPAYTGPRGTAGGTPLVNGSHAAGVRSLVTDGWSAAATFLKGDYFQVGDYLYMVVYADGTADGSGNMTITFEPALRVAAADNAPITKSAPKGIWRLASDDQGEWDEQIGPVFGFALDAHEALGQ